jgi:hypothetical protein
MKMGPTPRRAILTIGSTTAIDRLSLAPPAPMRRAGPDAPAQPPRPSPYALAVARSAIVCVRVCAKAYQRLDESTFFTPRTRNC